MEKNVAIFALCAAMFAVAATIKLKEHNDILKELTCKKGE